MLSFIAHAGETHEGVTESTIHWLDNWYFAVPLYFLAIFFIASVVFFISKRSLVATYLTTVATLLFSGIYFYDKSPVLSVIAVSIGLFGSLVSVLAALGSSKTK